MTSITSNYGLNESSSPVPSQRPRKSSMYDKMKPIKIVAQKDSLGPSTLRVKRKNKLIGK